MEKSVKLNKTRCWWYFMSLLTCVPYQCLFIIRVVYLMILLLSSVLH